MALTRPNLENILTNVALFTDSMTVINSAASQANVDVGFVMNRAMGMVPNAAFYWSESTQSFVTALTANAGVTFTNIAPTSYANITSGNIIVEGGIFTPTGGRYSPELSTSSPTPPSSPNVGDMWYNTNTDDIYRWTTDGNVAYWLDVTGPSTANNVILTYTLNGVTNSSIFFGGANITATATLVDSVPVTGNTTVSWKATSTDNINNRYAITSIDAVSTGSQVFYNEYGFVSSQSGYSVATFTSNISNGNVNLYAVGDSNNVSVTFERTVLGLGTARGYIGQTGPQGPIGPVGNVAATGSNIVTTSTNVAISTTTGALQVAGGAGIGGNVYVGGNVVTTTGVFWAGNGQPYSANIAAFLPTYTGTLTAGNIVTTNGVYWANGNAYSSGSGKSTSSPTAPTSPGVGDIWYNTTTDDVYRYTTDGVNFFWLDITGPSAIATGNANNLSGNTITANQLVMYGNILPGANVTYNIGSPTQRFASLYLSGNTIDLGGAVVKTDATSGAIAFIPVPTAANPNPTGIVVSPSGSITTVTTTGGNLNANSISNASNSIVGTGSVVGNLVASGNAVIQNINLAGGNNLLLQSQTFNTTWNNQNLTITANATVAPDGTNTASSLVPTTSSALHRIQQSYNWPLGNTYTASVYAKANGYRYLYMNLGNEGVDQITFDLQAGTIVATTLGTGTITYVGNGWYRCSAYGTVTTTGINNYNLHINNTTSAADNTFAGDGTSGIYLWGAQLELGVIASPYTPTTTSAITTYNNLYIPQGNIIGSPTVAGNLTVTGNTTTTGTETVGNLITTGGIFWANGVSALANYGNTQMLANLAATNNPVTFGGNIIAGANVFVGNNYVFLGNASTLVGGYIAPLSWSNYGGTSGGLGFWPASVVPSSTNYSLILNNSNNQNSYSALTHNFVAAGTVNFRVTSGTASSTNATSQGVVVAANSGLGVTGDSYFNANLGVGGNVTIGANIVFSDSSAMTTAPLGGGILRQTNPFGDGTQVAYFPLNGNFTDQMGTYNGTVTGTVNFSSAGNKFGYTSPLFGSGNYFTSTASMGISGASARSVSSWVKLSSRASTNDPQSIVGWGSLTTSQTYALVSHISSTYQWGIWGYANDSNSGILPDLNWHFITHTYDGNMGILYLDGQVIFRTTSWTLSTTSTALNIGTVASNSSYYFPGYVNSVRIFNRAISPYEILQLMYYGK